MKKISLLLVILVIAVHANAQLLRSISYYARNYNGFSEKHKTHLKRYYVGYGIQSMSFDVTAHYVAPGDESSTPALSATDVTKKFSINSSKSFSSTAGTFCPLMATSRNSGIGLDIAVNGEAYQYSTAPISYGSSFTVQEDGITEIVSVPMALVFKSGGEMSLKKRDNVLFAFGFGIAPGFSISKMYDVDAKFVTRRFVMMEFGVLTGIAWKIRATYYSGNVSLMNLTGGDPTNASAYNAYGPVGFMDVTTKGSSSLNVSLLLLPFSWNWEKKDKNAYYY